MKTTINNLAVFCGEFCGELLGADCSTPRKMARLARFERATAWFVAPRLILKNQSTSTLFRGKKSLLRPISINDLGRFCGRISG